MSIQVVVDTLENEWEIISEICHKPIYDKLVNPAVVILQHKGTKEIRIDVYGCDEGLPITFTNAGTNDERAKWFRDIRCRRDYKPLRVRFLGSKLDLIS